SRINDPGQFGDVMSELFVWGWLRSYGHEVRLNQEEGLADLLIAPSEAPIWGDVKRIRLDTKPTHVRDVIKKANKQIKRSGAEAGVAFVQVERTWEREFLDDANP